MKVLKVFRLSSILMGCFEAARCRFQENLSFSLKNGKKTRSMLLLSKCKVALLYLSFDYDPDIRIYLIFAFCKASVAQMVEQLTCNQWVGGSIPFAGSNLQITVCYFVCLC